MQSFTVCVMIGVSTDISLFFICVLCVLFFFSFLFVYCVYNFHKNNYTSNPLCLPKKLIRKHAPLEFEHKIYQPAWELNLASPINHSSLQRTVTQSPQPLRQMWGWEKFAFFTEIEGLCERTKYIPQL